MTDQVNQPTTPSLTPENIQQYLDTMSKSMLDTLKQYMDTKITGINSRIDEVSKATSPKQDVPKDATQARLTELENQLKAAKEQQEIRDKEASQLRFNQSLSQELDNYPLGFKQDTLQILQSRLQDVTEVDGKWQTKDGKLLQEYISSFMSSDLGKHLQVSTSKPGTGTPEASKVVPSNTKSLEKDIWDAFVS